SPLRRKPGKSEMCSYFSGGISMTRLGYMGFMHRRSFLPSTTRRPLMTVGGPHSEGHFHITPMSKHFWISDVTNALCKLVLR
ncbi:hypothetical protein VOLCADRAFT_65556, partial [Volvox carteri f. nagariensis]